MIVYSALTVDNTGVALEFGATIMSGERLQGRPRGGTAEVGRDKIIARLQEMVRSTHDFDASRKTLAEYVGVTPALISYYFPKKEILLEEVVRPIIAGYADALRDILESELDEPARLRRIVALLLNLYTIDGSVLDSYYNASRRLGEIVPGEVSRMTGLLAAYFGQKGGDPTKDQFNAAVLQGAVWGMCRFAARACPGKALSEIEIQNLAAHLGEML